MSGPYLYRFPAVVRIEPVIESRVLDQRFSFYFVTGTMDDKQFDTLTEELGRAVVQKLPLDNGMCVFSGLASRAELDSARKSLPSNLSGRYYSIAKRFHEEYDRVFSNT